jgi:hypothetical protein
VCVVVVRVDITAEDTLAATSGADITAPRAMIAFKGKSVHRFRGFSFFFFFENPMFRKKEKK